MPFGDYPTPGEVAENLLAAEKQLDTIYHAIPEWVHRLYPNLSLAEKVYNGFEYSQKRWTRIFLKEVQNHRKMREFALHLAKTHDLDWGKEYWNFLVSKDLPKSFGEASEC